MKKTIKWRPLVLILAIVISTTLFWVGFHNVDIVVNDMNLNGCAAELQEVQIGGQVLELQDVYLNGITFMMIAFMIIIAVLVTYSNETK